MPIRLFNDFPHPISYHDCHSLSKFQLTEFVEQIKHRFDDLEVTIYFDENVAELNPNKNSKHVLIRTEPFGVRPDLYRTKLSTFDLIIDFGRPDSGESIGVPWPIHSCVFSDYFHSSKLIDYECNSACLINGKKVSLSKNNLYGLRLALSRLPEVKVFGRKHHTLSLAYLRRILGAIWHSRKNFKDYDYRKIGDYLLDWLKPYSVNHQGLAGSKFITYNKFKVALIVENDLNYVSEKFFEAFFSKAIILYIGGPIKEFGIPPDLYITGSTSDKTTSNQIQHLLENDKVYQQINELKNNYILANKESIISFSEIEIWHRVFNIIHERL